MKVGKYMSRIEKYQGVIPAFYACYDEEGNISPERVQTLAKYYRDAGVQGLYVGGSSGECIYQSVDERKLVLENVMEAVGEDLIIIVHVAAMSTRDSVELAKHAESVGADALSAIPTVYFGLSEAAIEDYWTAMVDATDLDFIIYNIPQTTNYSLSLDLFKKMVANDKVIGVKNSSMPTLDIYQFIANAGKDFVVFNGPDEQFISGLVMGAQAGIGGTYGVMPELFLAAFDAVKNNEMELAREIQYAINEIILLMVSGEGHMYAVIKEILAMNGLEVGTVRNPLPELTANDQTIVNRANDLITEAKTKYVK